MSLRWSGVMDSDTMFSNMYTEYYQHDRNRWASFIIDDVLEQVINPFDLIFRHYHHNFIFTL